MRAVLLFIILILTSCRHQPSTEELASSDNDKCQQFGFSKGSENYGICRLTLDQNRAQMGAQLQSQRATASAILGSAIIMRPPYYR